MFFLFLSPVQILHRGNVLQHLTEPTIFPSNNNVHPQHSHRNKGPGKRGHIVADTLLPIMGNNVSATLRPLLPGL